ncbi:signal peptidase II [Pararobbsia silviterrae]|uniref:Lipoprotein signal peptidase n=1 Tax=Pararobbsia silviterrae TaxID=1792498 RepID=A0A494Y358_9BURK|nr:signal peptidase II [Pararobbsia silviterrae]RKP56739.1 lipoprotein signal peptidase [Pararobbsia silviterrae]
MATSRQQQGVLIPWLGLALVVVLIDQVTKITMTKLFAYGAGRVITPFFNLVLTYNTGAAFSFLAASGGWQRWFFTALAIGAAWLIVYLLRRHGNQTLFCFALAMILGGAIGNVIDRAAYGHVIDFLDFHLNGWHFATFNLADSAITLGAILLIVDELLRVRGSR